MKNFAYSAAILALAATASAQTRDGAKTHVTGNSEFGSRVTSSAKVYRTPYYRWIGRQQQTDVFGGVDLQMSNRAHNATGTQDVGAVRIIGGQWKYHSDTYATNYGYATIDVGGKRMLTQGLQGKNLFFSTYYYDSGWRGCTVSFLLSLGMEARMVGTVSAFVDLTTSPSFGIWGQARAYSYARGMSRQFKTFLGLGANYYSDEMHGEVQTRLDGVGVFPSVAHGRGWHDKRPSRITFWRVSRYVLFSSTAVLLDLRDPAFTQTWFDF